MPAKKTPKSTTQLPLKTQAQDPSLVSNEDHATATPAQTADSIAYIFRVQGRMSTFGGPGDLDVKPSEGLALFEPEDVADPRFRALFLATQPEGTTGLARRLNPDRPYLACRWDYAVTSRSFLRNSLARVQSMRTEQSLLVQPVDHGPDPGTGRVADLSPGAAAALGLNTDDEVLVTIQATASSFQSPKAFAAFVADPDLAEPAVRTTQAWGAAPAKVSYFAQAPAAGIVVHNTATPNRPAKTGEVEWAAARALALSIQHSHMEADHAWADTGQHFTVSRGGLILEGRHGSLNAARSGAVVQAAHAESNGNVYNRTWYGIEVEGTNLPTDQVTDEQYASLVRLCGWLMKWRGVKGLPIVGHQDVLAGHTDCPGQFEARLPALRTDVAAFRQRLG